MSRKRASTSTEQSAPVKDKLESLARKIHDESEETQKKYFKNDYVVKTWNEIPEGFYKDNVRKIAKKKLGNKG